MVGSAIGLELFTKWCVSFNKPVVKSKETSNSRREVPFPGFDAVINAKWPSRPAATRVISRTELLNAIRMKDRHQAVYAAVELFVEEVRRATKDDDAQVDIWFIVIPDEIYLYGSSTITSPGGNFISTGIQSE